MTHGPTKTRSRNAMMTYKIGPERRREKCRWATMLPTERARVSNGCGGKGGWFNPPEYRFRASCDQHDINYWLGGTEEDRKKADQQFLAAMLIDAVAGDPNLVIQWWCKGAAYRYYWAVRTFGKKFFTYRQVTEDQQWDRLEAIMSFE